MNNNMHLIFLHKYKEINMSFPEIDCRKNVNQWTDKKTICKVFWFFVIFDEEPLILGQDKTQSLE